MRDAVYHDSMQTRHTQKWDLSSIPDQLFNKEWSRRHTAARVYKRKIVTCERCGKKMSVTEARFRCPEHTPPAARGVVTVRRAKKST